MGARGQAMGNATACLTDEWSMQNNVAGLAGVKANVVGISYDILPALPAFARMALTAVRPAIVTLGVGMYRFGDDAYHEQIVAAGAATKWNHTQVGLKVNYITYAADGMGSRSFWTVSMGGITTLTSKLAVGAHIANVNQPWLSKQYDERLPTILTAGLMFTLDDHVRLAAEVEQRINDVATGRAGLEFSLLGKLTTRLGVQLNPQALSGGLGFRMRYFTADYSAVYLQLPGMRHQLSISFRPGSQKPRKRDSVADIK